MLSESAQSQNVCAAIYTGGELGHHDISNIQLACIIDLERINFFLIYLLRFAKYTVYITLFNDKKT